MSEEMSSSEQSTDLQQLHDCRFPEGLKVLVVETDEHYLRELEDLLLFFPYEVTKCDGAHEALKLLKEKESPFDILVADFDTIDMNGFKFLGSVVAATESLPVARDRDPKLIKTGLVRGACAFLGKPLSMEAMDMLWHLAVREKRPRNYAPESISTLSDVVATHNKGKRHVINHDQDIATINAKKRFIWSHERQEMFKKAVEDLNLENATPKTIHQYMHEKGVTDLTRRHISSHLQKYRSEVKQQQQQEQQQIGVPFPIPNNLPCNPSNSYNPSVLSGLIHNNNNVVPNAAGLCSSQNDLGFVGFGENPEPSAFINPNPNTNGATLTYPRTMLSQFNHSNNSTMTSSVFQNQNRLINHGVLPANNHHQSANYNPMMMESMINDGYHLPYQAEMQQQLLNDVVALNDELGPWYSNFQEDVKFSFDQGSMR